MGNKTLAGIAGAGLVGIVALVAVLITIAAQGAGPEPDHTRDTGLEAEAGIGRQSPDTRPSNPAVAVTLEKAADGAEPPDTGLEAEPGTVFQSPDTHPNPDAPIIAAQMGLTLEKATAVVVWQDEWGGVQRLRFAASTGIRFRLYGRTLRPARHSAPGDTSSLSARSRRGLKLWRASP